MNIFSEDGKRPDQHKVDAEKTDLALRPSGLVPTAAFSVLKNFEECPYRVYLSKVKKLKGPTSAAGERGNEIHDILEHYIKGEGDALPPPKCATKMAHEYYTLRTLHDQYPERFQLEQNWGFTKFWEPTGWFDDDVWLRQKLDVYYQEDETSAILIDHKSGKKWGNELKHGDQGLQYAIGAFMKYPKLQFVETNFNYVDKGEQTKKQFTRQMAMTLLPRLERRIFALTTATEEQLLIVRPSKHNCRYCDHAASGECEHAIR